MKKTVWIAFILGVILICAFFTPISQAGSTQRGYYYEYGVRYSSIIDTTGVISVGRFFIFLIIWAVLCYSVARLVTEFTGSKPSTN